MCGELLGEMWICLEDFFTGWKSKEVISDNSLGILYDTEFVQVPYLLETC